ncbi:phosphoenolpyruvate synthase [Candidatus Pacearchaeota archaeon]|nr:phosphoenolpyruvate synthase [Candidatus Pacearchaeota archaeon]
MKKEVKIEEKYIRWFSALSIRDVKFVGGKAANLGEMYNLGLPVPPGFALTAQAYSYFLDASKIKEKIYEIINSIEIENTKELEIAAEKIRKIIENSPLPKDMEEEILEAYESLSIDKSLINNVSSNVLSILKLQEPAFVAVRSSATSEDSSQASFAGQQESFLNVKGRENLIIHIKKCFASLFTARSIYYRVKKNFRHEDVLIAVVVQAMINSNKSGVIFSKNPLGNQEEIIIEAVFGLGEGIVSGKIEPDHYVVSRNLEILSKKTAEKKIALTRDSSGKNETIKLTEERSNSQVLTEYEIKKLADYSIKLETHYNSPQDIEFAIDSGNIYIVQTRPITTLNTEKEAEEISGNSLFTGQSASPGIGIGKVKIITTMNDLEKVRKGDILVTEMTNPDMVVAMQKCAAIVTDEGGMTSHAAIVSREMGIPAVVGTKIATKKLKDEQIITVDGFKGIIYEGDVKTLKSEKIEILPIEETKTKIKVIIDLPNFAERAAKTNCKDVGLTRLEGIIAESGKHPFYFIKQSRIKDYEELIYSGIKKIAEHFQELWIRTSDIRSDEYRNLEGSPEKIELNPMLGMHGIRFSLKYPEIIKAEIRAMSRIKGKTIGIMIPQLISISELKELKKIMSGLNAELKLGVMIETPAAVQIISELCNERIKFISFGTNDLTQYTLAIDRGNEDIQYLYNEMHPAILSQLKEVIKICKKHNVETSICGQSASNKEMAEFLVKNGIDSLSVNADKAREISLLVKGLEDKGLKGIELKENIEEKRETENKKQEEIIEKQITPEKPAEEENKTDKKQKYKINCSECKKETEVPFKPDGIRPVYCRECFDKNKLNKNKSQKTKIEEEKKQENIPEIPEAGIEIDIFSSQIQADARKEGNKEEKPEEKIIEENKDKKEEVFYTPESEKIIEEEKKILDIF